MLRIDSIDLLDALHPQGILACTRTERVARRHG